MTITRGYGWKPDAPDARDFIHQEVAKALPAETDLTALMPPIYDQGQLGSCTANAIAAAFDTARSKQGEAFETPSRLAIYYNERKMEGDVSQDGGAAIRDGIKTLKVDGAGPESLWPYNIAKFAEVPPAKYVKEALKFEALSYARVVNSVTAKQQVLAAGRPFVFGFTVYQSFESAQVARTGILPMPEPGEQQVGGHAVVANGYKTIGNHLYWRVRNSWGATWGDRGHFWMPYQYSMSDLWVINKVM